MVGADCSRHRPPTINTVTRLGGQTGRAPVGYSWRPMRMLPRLITQGHRGARGVLPENTLASFSHAMAVGVDRVEIDLNLTADDILVVVHDETTHPDLVRGPDGAWVRERTTWRSMPVSRVRALDVGRARPGSHYAARFPRQQPADGERIPLFDEIAALAKADGRCGINIEIKCDPASEAQGPSPEHFAERVVEAVGRHGIGDRVTVQSFNWSVVTAVRRLSDTISTGCLTSERPDFDTVQRHGDHASPWTDGRRPSQFAGSMPAMVASMGVDYWASEFRDLDTAHIDEAHELGLEVHCWTVNDPDDIKRLISWGVDSIITDYPDDLIALVRQGGVR